MLFIPPAIVSVFKNPTKSLQCTLPKTYLEVWAILSVYWPTLCQRETGAWYWLSKDPWPSSLAKDLSHPRVSEGRSQNSAESRPVFIYLFGRICCLFEVGGKQKQMLDGRCDIFNDNPFWGCQNFVQCRQRHHIKQCASFNKFSYFI